MPDWEWLISTEWPTFPASSESAGTVGFGVAMPYAQSGTICFQNSACAARGNCILSKTSGYLGPKRNISQADSRPAEMNAGKVSAGALPVFTVFTDTGLPAERPRQAWSIT